MYTRRIVYYFGCGVLFLCCSPLAVADDGIEYPFITSSSYSSYPVYFWIDELYDAQTGGSTGNNRYSNPSASSHFYGYFLDSDCNFISNSNSPLSREIFLKAFFSAFSDDVKYQSIMDFTPNPPLNLSSNTIFCELLQYIDVLNAPVTSNRKIMISMGFMGYFYIRTVKVKDEIEPKYFDVFVYGQVGRPSVRNENGTEISLGCSIIYNTDSYNILLSGSDASIINSAFTYQLCASYRMDKNGNIISYSKDGFGLPFYFDKSSRAIEFCLGKNGYWTGDSASSYPNIVTLPFFTSAAFNGAFQRFYTDLTILTAAQRYVLNITDIIPFTIDLDTDSGGMTDYHEWYQTKHDLLDPSDDVDDTPESEAPEVTNPAGGGGDIMDDIPEGESVVDIGKDTIERYKYLLDSAVGDSDELPTVNAPIITDPENFELENFSIPSLASSITTSAESSLQSYQGRLNDLFSPMSSGVQAPDLTFDPSVHLPSLNTSLSLDPVSLNPTSILGFNTRAAVSYAAPFAPFRVILLVAQSLLFIWCCIKLVFNTMAPGSSGENDT